MRPGQSIVMPPESGAAAIRRFLPWIVATALFMETLDSTIVNTSIPAIASSLGVTPLSLKAVASAYILSLAVSIPLSGWLAERFGSRRIFSGAVALFTLASVLCALSIDRQMLVAARVAQGFAAAMMMPVGRIAIVRTFAKNELLRAMNFVIMPALMGPLLGPTVGGLIVHWTSWRVIFLINVPVGLLALWLAHRHMPDYRADTPRPLDWRGLLLFGSGSALLSWLLEVFGEHGRNVPQTLPALVISLSLLLGYGWHAQRTKFPLLSLDLFRVRTFRVSVLGGFVTRLGVGAMPLLLPLFYQLGLGLPAWQSGLLMMPAAAAAIGMKALSSPMLRRLGYRRVLTINTVLVAGVIATFSTVTSGTPVAMIAVLSLLLGLFNSLQFSSMNSLAYADVAGQDATMAATIASTLQQMSMSFGLASGSLIVALYLGELPQHAPAAITDALHRAFLTLACLTLLSSLSFRRLHQNDGESVSKGTADPAPSVATTAPGTVPGAAADPKAEIVSL